MKQNFWLKLRMLGIDGIFFNTPEEIDLWDNLALTFLMAKIWMCCIKKGKFQEYLLSTLVFNMIH